MQTHFIKTLLAFSIFLLSFNGRTCSALTNKSKQSTSQPNIIFILADDLGYNDVSYHGKHHGSAMKTPNIDNLAAEGVTLDNYYVQPICTPTRSQLMSGRYQVIYFLLTSVRPPCDPYWEAARSHQILSKYFLTCNDVKTKTIQ